MKYMLMIYGNEAERAKMMTEPGMQQQELDAYNAFYGAASSRATIAAAEWLHNTQKATSVRVRDGKTVTTDGPFAETKEQLGGFYLLDCKDLDEAIELAAMIPGAQHGAIEIRPVVVFE